MNVFVIDLSHSCTLSDMACVRVCMCHELVVPECVHGSAHHAECRCLTMTEGEILMRVYYFTPLLGGAWRDSREPVRGGFVPPCLPPYCIHLYFISPAAVLLSCSVLTLFSYPADPGLPCPLFRSL